MSWIGHRGPIADLSYSYWRAQPRNTKYNKWTNAFTKKQNPFTNKQESLKNPFDQHGQTLVVPVFQ